MDNTKALAEKVIRRMNARIPLAMDRIKEQEKIIVQAQLLRNSLGEDLAELLNHVKIYEDFLQRLETGNVSGVDLDEKALLDVIALYRQKPFNTHGPRIEESIPDRWAHDDIGAYEWLERMNYPADIYCEDHLVLANREWKHYCVTVLNIGKGGADKAFKSHFKYSPHGHVKAADYLSSIGESFNASFNGTIARANELWERAQHHSECDALRAGVQ